MTIMQQQPTGSRVLRSPSQVRERRHRHPAPCDSNVWFSTFVEISSSSGLRDAVAHFSGALDPCAWDQFRVEVFKGLDGQLNLSGSALWLTAPYTFIDTVMDTETDSRVDETADVVDAFERLRAELGLTQKEMFTATGISKRTFHSWSDKPAGSRPRVASLGRLWELADAVDDLRETLDQPLSRWLRGDEKRIGALLDGRFDELVDLAVDRAPFPRREIGTSVYEGIAADVETPIIRGSEPLVTEDVEDGFAR
ncbi:helix-turn-helix domain-containing protein [Mycolicibacterium austroafricanum]|uniref:helix-turn-helix domain-containing protein n=1 Tax=Mycolicibacterium austroafricanum TaxID=39687 RepID=UPI001CA36E9B|nr:helix-turn-helix transcriptional regulator [Mycolicibacterium austroafricanum]QZT56230.1 helix-turn-helix domain-containing protein [Mycolicibacterium austroafricanum]